MDINEVARLAGVSRATVSRYLNDGYVSREKREVIRRVIAETGYVPSRSAKSLRTGRTGLVGVIIPKVSSKSVGRMLAGISGVLEGTGRQLLLGNTDGDPAREVEYLRLFSEGERVDGIILVATVFTPRHLEVMGSLDVPLVVLGQRLEGHPCVYQDDYGAMRELAAHVLARSERPAFMGVHDEDRAAGRARRSAFLDECAARGVRVPAGALAETARFSVREGHLAADRILDACPETDAIVCAADSLAYGALTCLRERGLDVPGDVALAGVDDSELSRVVTPALTTVHLPFRTSGASAAGMLLGLMGPGAGGDAGGADAADDMEPGATEVRMGYELVVRDSTRR